MQLLQLSVPLMLATAPPNKLLVLDVNAILSLKMQSAR